MKVKIKTWNQLKNEFDLDEFGNIHSDITFVEEMELNMPDDRIIDVVPRKGKKYFEWIDSTEVLWYISKDVIEEIL